MSCTKPKKQDFNLLQVWEVGFGAFKKAYDDGNLSAFAKFRQMVLGKFTVDSVQYARLNDETVYVKLLELMGVYKKIVLEVRIESGIRPEAKTLLDGICEVLVSRLSQFFAKFPSGLGSPVRAEKIQIIEEAMLVLAEKIDKIAVKQDDGAICLVGAWLANSKMSLVGVRLASTENTESNEVVVDFPKETVENVYKTYTDELLACLTKLDDLHQRKVAGYFMDLLEREWEELGNIIKVQVGVLEEHSGVNDDPVAKVLGMLREIYQHLGPVIEEYKNLLSSARPHPESFISSSEFYAYAQSLQFSIEVDIDEFLELLLEEVKLQTGKLFAEFSKATYKVKRLISGDVLLAAEITKAFNSLLELLPNSDDEVAGAILKGIKETTEIKISSLNDSVEEFEEQGQKHVLEMGTLGQALQIPDEITEAILDSVRVSWLNSLPDDVEKFFDACVGGDEFLPAREFIEKAIDAELQKVEKNLLVFKREVLLYEVCTFEEILTHSVPKLESSECEFALLAASQLRDVFKALEVILKKNNISVIRPDIRSEFNAKEHEVLVAEKNEEFAKGEIIKVLTAGYLYKDNVVLRANVIAAR